MEYAIDKWKVAHYELQSRKITPWVSVPTTVSTVVSLKQSNGGTTHLEYYAYRGHTHKDLGKTRTIVRSGFHTAANFGMRWMGK